MVTSLRTFYIINIVMLVVGPLAVGALVFGAYRQNKLYWSPRGWGRTFAAIIISGGLTIGLGMILARVNPFVSDTAIYPSRVDV